jgi:hypothetical protein
MSAYYRKKSLVIISIGLCLFVCCASLAAPVNIEQVRKASDTFLKSQHVHQKQQKVLLSRTGGQKAPAEEFTAAGLKEIRGDDGTVLAFITELEPRGFIAVSADTDITPIVAYSFNCSFPASNDKKNPLYRMLKEDMKLRAKALAKYQHLKKAENNGLWNFYANGDSESSVNQTFQQWPEENATATGGWVETTWVQDSPYNDLCPLDPVDANRCYVGCVATAMAQMLNYHQKCAAQFDENDSYVLYSGLKIDDDSELYDFPSFEQLNNYLSNLQRKYIMREDIDNTDVAALSFACGVASKMEFSSWGSGASEYDAQEALLDKFGFHSAELAGNLSRESYLILQENIMNKLPALLGINDEDGSNGHFIVCDGYNTNGEYHLNFGWGSPYPEEITEVWYKLPSELPPYMNIFSEVMLNIQPVQSSVDISPLSLTFHSFPRHESESQRLFMINNTQREVSINSISSPEGFLISLTGGDYSDNIESFEMQSTGQEVIINVKFSPEREGGYYGILKIHYDDGNTKNVILKGNSFSGGIEISAGRVFGTWYQSRSPYFIEGDIEVPEYGELVIEPGVKVIFLGPYGMTIRENAVLIARGSEVNPIEFTALNKDIGWGGLRFLESNSDDILNYCVITDSKKGSGFTTDDTGGGDAGAEDEDRSGGAVYCYASNPIIMNCKITNNMGEEGGAIYCVGSYPIISNTLIANNTAIGGYLQCGGIYSDEWGVAEIRNCTIVNNLPGGIFSTSQEGMSVTNTIVWGNDSYQIETQESRPTVSFCNIEGGYEGEGNIDLNPSFFEPSSGTGAEYNGTSANWSLQSTSPCINSGTEIELPLTDLAGNLRICGDIVDLGAYENQSDLPLITINPSGKIDAGFIHVDSSSTVSFNITNTGGLGFEVESLSISESNDVFSIVTDIENRFLEPGDSVQVDIRFAPIEEKVYTGTIRVQSTSSNAPNKQIVVKGVGVSGTIIPAGMVYGTWTIYDSPYVITGDINVRKGRSLDIEPGVVVKFAGHFSLTVGYRAILRAIGTGTEYVVFTPMDTDEGWYGIRFVNTDDDDVLRYCTIEYSKKPSSRGNGDVNLMGGGILCCGSIDDEPGYIIPSSPTIESCLIADNHAQSGGGIWCMDYSEVTISSCTIVDNSAERYGAGIGIISSNCEITNNVIAHNYGGRGGGIFNWFGVVSIINNTIVHNRPSGIHLDITPLSPWDPGFGMDVYNNIVWHNEIYMSESTYLGEYDIRFNNIQGGWEGEGNMNLDPYFADTDARNGDYHLKSEAGRWDPYSQAWVSDDVTSPCINAGMPGTPIGSEPSPNGNLINMGAYGGTAQASKGP